MQKHRSKARVLREMVCGPDVVRVVGAHDAIGAKLIERAGFEAVWASSFEISTAYGVPDASLVTLTQFLDAAEVMDMAVQIPIVADIDTGFGGPSNVEFAVQRYERRGIAAVCMEDKLFPKINSFADVNHDLLSTEEFALKIKAAKHVQESSDFMVIARTEALIADLGVPEALERANAYASAGADAILVHSKSKRPDEVLEFADQWTLPIPLVAVPTTYCQVTEKELQAAGLSIVIYANQGLRSAITGIRGALSEIARTGHASAVESSIATMPEAFDLQGMPARFGAKR